MLTKFIKLISLAAIVLLVSSPVLADTVLTQSVAGKYTNPLPVHIPGGGVVESCADPSIIYGNDGYWYMYCTTDPLNGNDETGGNFNFRLIPILRSSDLVNWTYITNGASFRVRTRRCSSCKDQHQDERSETNFGAH